MADEFSEKARAFLIDSLLAPDQDEAIEVDDFDQSPLNLVENEDVEAKASDDVMPATTSNQSDIMCDLTRPELWRKFAEIGTEMIITKAGRRMFPTVQVQFSGKGINEAATYLVVFEIVPASGKRFRYSYLQSSWTALDSATASCSNKNGNYFTKRSSASDFGREMSGNKLYVHPECPVSGRHLVDSTLSFERIKLTNNEHLAHLNDHMVLKSMHQYEPRVHLIELSRPDQACPAPNNNLFGIGKALPPANTVWTFNFSEARFMAVTAYQNQLITKLKIDHNPFAKGFRKISRYSVAQVHLAIGSALTGATTANLVSVAPTSPKRLQQDGGLASHHDMKPTAVAARPLLRKTGHTENVAK